MTKTYLELASETVTAMISKGQLRIPQAKDEKWEDYNRKAIHTVGWAILEMYWELKTIPSRPSPIEGEIKKKPRIITSAR